MKPELSIIVVSYNVRDLLLNCIKSIIDTVASIDYEIIIVDNASNDGSAEAVKQAFPQVQVIANTENIGFASANNQGYELNRGQYILLLNPDTVVGPGAIQFTLEFMKKTPQAGMAACRLIKSDSSLQKSIRSFPTVTKNLLAAMFLDRLFYREYRKSSYYRSKPHKIDYAPGAFLLIRKEALDGMPLFNPDFFMYAEEKDLALRLKRKGWSTFFVPFGEVVHYGGESTNQMAEKMFLELQESQILFFNFHHDGVYRWCLIWSYYLSLLSYWIASLFWPFTRYGRHRFKLFSLAVKSYPYMAFSPDCKF